MDTEIKHLPDKYDDFFGTNSLPSSFKLDEHVRKEQMSKDLMEFKAEDDEKHSSHPEVVAQDNDLAFARDSLKDAIKEAADLLAEAIVNAKASDSPRGFEVAATILSTISTMNTDLINMHQTTERTKKIRKERLGSDVQATQVTNQQNNYFVSPKDLIAQLRGGEEIELIPEKTE